MFCRYKSIFKNISFVQTDDWQTLIPYLKTQFKTTNVEKISYYGETSLCMPRFYAHKNNFASEFSIFIISLNFISFVYVCVSYIFIYKVTSNRPISNKQVDIQNAKTNSSMTYLKEKTAKIPFYSAKIRWVTFAPQLFTFLQLLFSNRAVTIFQQSALALFSLVV